MKNLILTLTFLLSWGAFAQPTEDRWEPRPDMEGWRTYEFYTCDSNGHRITDRRNPKYKKFTVEILVTIYGTPPTGILYTVVQQVSDQICKYGSLQYFYPNVRILDIEYSTYIGTGDPFGPIEVIDSSSPIKPVKTR
ncbi:hypothetical protein [Myroides sp. DW712]|uniref:hypothetical protein n=1 Tax=Myroides sp. DW712 TaxID=3389800 RepID=UPI00397BD223